MSDIRTMAKIQIPVRSSTPLSAVSARSALSSTSSKSSFKAESNTSASSLPTTVVDGEVFTVGERVSVH